MLSNNRIKIMFFVIGVLTLMNIFYFLYMPINTKLDLITEKINVRNEVGSGKATYLPGGACVIAATSDQKAEDIIRYAHACAASHEAWLNEKENEE